MSNSKTSDPSGSISTTSLSFVSCIYIVPTINILHHMKLPQNYVILNTYLCVKKNLSVLHDTATAQCQPCVMQEPVFTA